MISVYTIIKYTVKTIPIMYNKIKTDDRLSFIKKQKRLFLIKEEHYEDYQSYHSKF